MTLGHPKHVAAALSGVSDRQVRDWVARGNEAEELAFDVLNDLHPIGRWSISLLDDDPVPAPDRLDWGTAVDAVELNDYDGQGVWEWTPIAIARGDADPPFTRALLTAVPASERPYLRFLRHLERADGSAEGLLLNRAREATVGVPTRVVTTVETIDADGAVVGTVRTTKESHERDNAMIRWMLAVRWPERYGRRFRAEVLPGNEAERDEGLGSLEDEKGAAIRELDALEDEVARQREKRAS